MQKKYSATTGGIYIVGVHTSIPPDAVDITNDEHLELLQAQSQGKSIGADALGRPVAIDPALRALQNDRRTTIRKLAADAANANVNAIGIEWQGGFDSAIKLDAAKRLAEAAGATTVVLYDAEDVAHTLDMADATTVAIAVAAAYQAALAKKKAAFRAISAANTAEQLDAITWS